MRALGGLHVALGHLTVSYEPDRDLVFVQVTDPGFLIAETPGLLRHYGPATSPADTAIARLAEHRPLSARYRGSSCMATSARTMCCSTASRWWPSSTSRRMCCPCCSRPVALYWYLVNGRRALSVAGHAFVHHLRRGHYDIAADTPSRHRLRIAFDDLATAI